MTWSKASRAWYYRNQEKVRQQRAQYRLQAMEILGGIKCSWPNGCNCANIDLLEIDHVKGGGDKERRYNGLHGGWVLAREVAQGRYPKEKQANLRVLCTMHNWLAHVERKRPDLKGQFEVKFKEQ